MIIANLSDTGSINVRNREISVFQKEVTPKKGFWGGMKEFFKEMNDPEYFQEKHRKIIEQQMKK